jgi:hypothetical protein
MPASAKRRCEQGIVRARRRWCPAGWQAAGARDKETKKKAGDQMRFGVASCLTNADRGIAIHLHSECTQRAGTSSSGAAILLLSEGTTTPISNQTFQTKQHAIACIQFQSIK